MSGLLDNLKILIGENTTIVIENHYLGKILDYGQFDTFYHEHPRTYSFLSFQKIAATLRLNLIDSEFVSRYGGNIRAYIGHGRPTDLVVDESYFSDMFATMRASTVSWVNETRAMIDNLVSVHGKLRAKAFPGRSAILVKLLGLTDAHISAVYEIKGSVKAGHYVPGTRIPILPEAMLFAEPDLTRPILNLAWHIPAEVRANLTANGYTGPVIDIKSFVSQRV